MTFLYISFFALILFVSSRLGNEFYFIFPFIKGNPAQDKFNFKKN